MSVSTTVFSLILYILFIGYYLVVTADYFCHAINRVPVKALSFVIDKSFSSFDKSGFSTSEQKWQNTQTKTGSHYIYIKKWWNIFKKLTGTLIDAAVAYVISIVDFILLKISFKNFFIRFKNCLVLFGLYGGLYQIFLLLFFLSIVVLQFGSCLIFLQ